MMRCVLFRFPLLGAAVAGILEPAERGDVQGLALGRCLATGTGCVHSTRFGSEVIGLLLKQAWISSILEHLYCLPGIFGHKICN